MGTNTNTGMNTVTGRGTDTGRQEHGIRHVHIQILVLDYETKGPKSIPNQST